MGEELTAAHEAAIRRRQTFRLATIAVIVAAGSGAGDRQPARGDARLRRRRARGAARDRTGRRIRGGRSGELAVDKTSARANRVIRSQHRSAAIAPDGTE